MINKICRGSLDALMAMILISTVIAGSAFLSLEVKASALYRQSRILSMLLRQESNGIPGILRDTRNLDMAVSFAGALAAAYINFELIPINEAATFAAVFESLPTDAEVTGFEYRRGILHITGEASAEGYDAFIKALREQGHFSSVTGTLLGNADNTWSFEIVCIIYLY